MKGKSTPIVASALLASLAPTLQAGPPVFSAGRIAANTSASADLDGGGSFQMSDFQVRSLLSRPFQIFPDVLLAPELGYRLSEFDTAGLPGGIPFADESLHSITLSTYILSMREGNPWVWGAWTRAELASDFQHLDGDDLSFDLAAGFGYQITPDFLLGFGVAAINLGTDPWVVPGIGFDWRISETMRCALIGPNLIASWQPAGQDDWLLSFRGEPGGGVWNVLDAASNSRNLDVTSYRLGLHMERRLGGEFWLSLGTGMAVAQEIEWTTASGSRFFKRDADPAWFGEISVSMKVW
jgi:hypothetical protein